MAMDVDLSVEMLWENRWITLSYIFRIFRITDKIWLSEFGASIFRITDKIWLSVFGASACAGANRLDMKHTM